MDISIIIPVYNVAEYVGKCIQSVVNQKGIESLNIECLVVDDRGSDNSMDIVRNVLDSYQGSIQFKIIEREANGGLSAARNSGIKEAKGDYLFFLDSDDYISDDCIARLYRHVELHPQVEVVFGKTVCVPDAKVKVDYFNFRSRTAELFVENIKLSEIYLNFPEVAWNKLIKRSFLLEHNLFFKDGILHEDYHWHLRSYPFISSVAIELDGNPTYFYLQRNNSIMGITTEEERYCRLLSIIENICLNDVVLWNHVFVCMLTRHLYKLQDMVVHNKLGWAQSQYQRLLLAISKNRSATSSIKLYFKYFELPRSFVRRKVSNLMFKIMFHGGD